MCKLRADISCSLHTSEQTTCKLLFSSTERPPRRLPRLLRAQHGEGLHSAPAACPALPRLHYGTVVETVPDSRRRRSSSRRSLPPRHRRHHHRLLCRCAVIDHASRSHWCACSRAVRFARTTPPSYHPVGGGEEAGTASWSAFLIVRHCNDNEKKIKSKKIQLEQALIHKQTNNQTAEGR